MKFKFTYYQLFILFSIKLCAQTPVKDSINDQKKNDSIFNNNQKDSII